MSSVPFSVFMGEGDALANIYREFYPRVLSLCRYILGSHEDAEDASNEVFARLPRALKTYDRSLPFARWITSVASHYCIDVLRRRRSESRVMAPGAADAEACASPVRSPLDDLLLRENQRAVRSAIAKLPDRYRAPLILRYYHELSYEEIAQQLNVTRANAKTLVFRAKREVHASLSDTHGARSPEVVAGRPA